MACFTHSLTTQPLWEGVLHLTYAENTGAAFSMLADKRWVFMTVSTVGILAMSVYLFAFKPKTWLENLALSWVIGGGIGNMIDRVALGYVVDFIDFRLINFAIFNGADSFVCVGAAMLILAMIFAIFRESKEKPQAKTHTESDVSSQPTGE